MKKILYLFLFIIPFTLLSQVSKDNTAIDKLKLPKTPRQYHTQKVYQEQMKNNKETAQRRAFWEFTMRDLQAKGLDKDVTIPVVVHVLYKTGTDKKLLPSVSDVKQQLNLCSKDFRQLTKILKHEADTKEKFSDRNALDTRIDFCLVSVDPKGRATDGVIFRETPIDKWTANEKMKFSATGSSPWDTEKYLNIWVVNFADTITGYAQMPGGNTSTDGIVIDRRYFGKKGITDKSFPYTEGKTLTHLIGSYLNLHELWSDTKLCADDGVEDTPIHNAPNQGVHGYRHISTCDGNPVEMTMNFMDNSNDEEQYMFTKGQMKRLQTTLTEGGIRAKLAVSGEKNCKKINKNAQVIQERNDEEQNITEPIPNFSYRLYPNPAQENLNLEIFTEKAAFANFTVFNAQGSIIQQLNYYINEGDQVFGIKCSQWSPGLYFVRLKINDEVRTEKVLINR